MATGFICIVTGKAEMMRLVRLRIKPAILAARRFTYEALAVSI